MFLADISSGGPPGIITPIVTVVTAAYHAIAAFFGLA